MYIVRSVKGDRMHKLSYLVMFPLLVGAGCAGGGLDWRSMDARVDYKNDFKANDGAAKIQVNGGEAEEDGSLNNLIYPYGNVKDEKGDELKTTSAEDKLLKGPDGKPGVFRFTVDSVSKTTNWFGTCFLGDIANDGIQIPALTAANATKAVVDQIIVEFRYRAQIKKPNGREALIYNFRVEPTGNDSFPNRASFDTIAATAEWKTFRARLGDAENLTAFLKAVNSGDNLIKLTWGDAHGSHNYRAGDSLLIDDIHIVQLK